MQSTGVYWIAVYDVLEEAGFQVCLANARETKNLPGRKTDVQESQWLLKLHTYGLLRNSFRPPEEILLVRTIWRLRTRHVREGARAIQHMQKALTTMNVQLANAISDVGGLRLFYMPVVPESSKEPSQGLVLIVDDDPVFISQLTQILIERGYLVLGAKDALSAMDLLNQHEFNFSLAIIDVFMPMGGGFELITKLSAKKADLKIIAVSIGRQTVLDKAITLGADAGVAKSQPGIPLDGRRWLAEVFLQIGLPV